MSRPEEAVTFSYERLFWGDLIYGTKSELQALGIAADKIFPGEIGGPKRRMSVSDPRGFPCVIERCPYAGPEIFSASIRFYRRPVVQKETFAAGVTKEAFVFTDASRGTAEALAAAGLVQQDQLPGLPGMPKTIVTVFPDQAICARRRRHGVGDYPAGTKQITKGPRNIYTVSITVSAEESERRAHEYRCQQRDRENQLRALPRPAPLVAAARQNEALRRRALIRLVWSKPAFQPMLTV